MNQKPSCRKSTLGENRRIDCHINEVDMKTKRQPRQKNVKLTVCRESKRASARSVVALLLDSTKWMSDARIPVANVAAAALRQKGIWVAPGSITNISNKADLRRQRPTLCPTM